ncbi:uncharacterized protein LOC34622963 [Cyclospora cayetanensis]|uniref:Uncharacterized protein LOC34622963 n=1 Tax=Cyclospora cayetanensis TaxID=88456 RepID=A0A6P6RZH9_9EIME|nr:uncharacterized protein LOC34622963 [Cyclospora cayetanensis]
MASGRRRRGGEEEVKSKKKGKAPRAASRESPLPAKKRTEERNEGLSSGRVSKGKAAISPAGGKRSEPPPQRRHSMSSRSSGSSSRSHSPLPKETTSESDNFWAKQASAWVNNKTSEQGPTALMALIATQAAVQMASQAEGSAHAMPGSLCPPGGRGSLSHPSAPKRDGSVYPKILSLGGGGENGLQGKSIPQWLRDVVREAGSKKGARDGKEGEEEEGGQLFTPSSKGAQSPRDASPAAAKDPMEKDSEGTSQPLLVEQIKEVVTEILSAVTDEIFREAAREAISNQRRKQRITGKTTIGLKLQGAGAANETDFQKEQSQQAEGNVATGFRKREDQEKLSSGVVNSDALAVGAYRCPSSATPPPPGVFSIVIYEDGLEFARVPFNGTHLLFGTSNKFANIIDSHVTQQQKPQR